MSWMRVMRVCGTFYFTGGFMAQYDGSIRINTKIDSKQASAQLMTLENRIVKTADKIAGLRSKMDALKNAKIPTQEYSEISTQIQKAESEFNKLLEKQEQMQREGKDSGVAWERLNEKMEEIGNTIRYAQGELQDLVDTGKAFTLGSDMEEFSKLGQQLQYAENDMAVLNQRHDELIAKQGKASGGYRKLGDVAKKSFNSVGNVLKKANSHVNSFGKRLKEIAHRILPTFHKEAKRTNTVLGQFSTRLKSLLSGMFIFNVISSYIRKMFSGVNEGFENFYNQNAAFKSSIDSMRTSLLQLKNTFAAAFAPIVSVAIPYLEKLISYITKAINSIGQLIAALLGKKTYTKAIRVNVENLEDTSDALEEVKEEAKEAEKALDGYLSPLDEINKYSEDKEIKVDIDTGKNPDASDIGDAVQDMFEEVPIDSYFLDLADKMKDIFSQLFAPLKEAWNREGKFVMDSWKYALEEIWKLAKDIGRDFLEVWNQEATINMLADMLHIIGDIGLVVGNLAGKFREAWNYNNTGLRILENIRDIFAVIVRNIREAADYTVEWTKTLDFKPLLQGIERLTASLVPFFDFVSGTLADFYTQFILPLTSWVLSEEGLPRLLNILSSFMEIVDWGALREALKSLYQALEPYAEAIGTGLLDFIEKMKDEGAEFFNYLPGAIQRAADALKSGNLQAAFEEFGSIAGEAVKHSFNMIITAIKSINWGEIGTLIASFINGIDWEGVGKSVFGALASAVNAAIDLIYNLISKTDWRSIGGQLGKSLSDAWVSIDWKQAGSIIGESFKSFFGFIAATIESIDWPAVGQKVKDFLVGIDWGGVAEAFFEAIGAVIGGLGAFLGGLISDGVAAAGEYFREKIEECGGNIVLGIFKGIQDAIKGIAEWITEHILFPFIEGFKKAFGIHSPSTVMAELGKYLIQGLLKGILSLVFDVEAIWNGMKDTAVNIWNGVKNFFSDTWGSIKQTASQIWGNIKQDLSEKWENLKSGAKSAFDGIKNGIKESWANIKSNVKESANNVKENIASAWEKAKENTYSAWSSIKEKAVSSAQSMTGSVQDKFSSMKSAVSNFSSSAQSIWSRAWEGMQGKVGSVLDSVRNTVSSMFGWISNTIGSLGNSLRSLTSRTASFRSASAYSFVSGYSFASAPYTPYQHPAFDALRDAEIPKLATGAVIPANREFLAVLGDQKHGTNIEAPLDTIRQASEEAVLNVLSRLGLNGNIGNSNPQTIIIKQYLDGKQVAEAMVKEGKVRQMSTGNNMFLLGTT